MGWVVLGTLVVGACASGSSGIELGSDRTTDSDQDQTVTTIDPDDVPMPPDGPGGDGGEDCDDVPVWVLKRTDDPDDEGVQPSDDDDECLPGGTELGTGDVQVTLRWSSEADLDLHVFEPDGTEIYFGDPGPTRTGGQLDVDSNIGCVDDGSVENIFWPEGEMPLGEYRIEVHGFTVDGCGGGDYTVVAKVEGEEILNETGNVGEDEGDPYTFEVS